MSIDRRLRRSLQDEGARIEPDAHAALMTVQRRATRARRRTRATALAAVVASALLVLVVLPRALELDRSGPDTAQLPSYDIRGSYVVDIGDTAAARGEGMVGRWVVSLETKGVLEIRAPAGFRGSSSGLTYRIEGDQLRTDALVEGPGCQVTGAFIGVYHWTADGDELRFDAVSDACPARLVLFDGQAWQRLP